MRPDVFDSHIADLSAQLRAQAGAGGGALSSQLRRAERLLTYRARKAGARIVEAEGLISHPHLRRRVDGPLLRRSFKILKAELATLNPAARRVDRVLGFFGAIAAGVVVLAAVIVGVLAWRGYV